MKRTSNFELLRIIAMYMIVLIHLCNYSNNFVTGKYHTFTNGLLNGICNIGVTCFILISGYFGMKFDIKKLVRLECMMISYSLIETAILCCFFSEQMKGAALLEQLIKSLLPFLSRKYWFYSCYVCILIFSGYIQKWINTLNQGEFKKLIILMLCLFSVLPTLFYFEIIPDNGKGFVQMLMIYLIGRYIRQYEDKPDGLFASKWKMGLIFIGLWILNGVSHELPIRIGGIYHHLCKDNSITNILMAVILFYFFKDLHFQSVVINRVAKYIFAVFALNNTTVDVTVELLKNRFEFQSPDGLLGFLLLLGCALGIMCCCVLAGNVRNLVLRRIDLRLEERCEKIFIQRKLS